MPDQNEITKDEAKVLQQEGLQRAYESVSDDQHTEDVPTGPIKKVLAWVGNNPERAQAALEVETGDEGENRTGLVEALQRVIPADE